MSDINLYTMEDLRELAKEGDARITMTGEVFLDHKHNGEYTCFEEYQGKNIITNEGLNYIFDVLCGAEGKPLGWYCGIYQGNYTPGSTNTASNSLGSGGLFTESLDATYTPATNRPAYTVTAAGTSGTVGQITNAASKAQFTIVATSATIYGAFLTTTAPKTDKTGKLLAAKLFTSARSVVATDELYVTYVLTAQSS